MHVQWPLWLRLLIGFLRRHAVYLAPSLKDYGLEQTLIQAAGANLLDRIGPAILLTHSQCCTYGWLWADARPKLVKAIVAIEPRGSPFQSTVVKDGTVKLCGITDIPISYDPPVDTINDYEAPLQTHEQPAPNGRTCPL